MLDGMRKVSQGWVGRIFMGLIMAFISLSFIVWGVGDIFRGFGTGKVADQRQPACAEVHVPGVVAVSARPLLGVAHAVRAGE